VESLTAYTSYIRSTPDKVWQALTTNETLSRYWMGAVFESDWKAGSSWRTCFPDGTPADSGLVLESLPVQRLVLTWRNEWKPEFAAEGDSICVYGLESVGVAVKLTVRHSIGHADSPFIQSVGEAWPMCISNLKSLLETGDIALADNPRHGD
jgi:uncharacterized protein YndB with AHSA1/START domain